MDKNKSRNTTQRLLTRRSFSQLLGGTAASVVSMKIAPALALAEASKILKRPIPSTGEMIPVVGMGSWITFNVGGSTKLRDARVKVLQAFFDGGGGMVDSSPMYGSSEDVIGYCLKRIENDAALFSATKVWTYGKEDGIDQMETSEKLWGGEKFDLLQVHNLLDWEAHLQTLKQWKEQGRVRYIGITTSHGRRHDEFAQIMEREPLDFVQFTYNVANREAEKRLLPLAADKGQAVIINRPYQRGGLFAKFTSHPLPDWAGEIPCRSWAEFFLKFVVSHPAVTCAIPATSRVDHMRENMGILTQPLPDADMRGRMVRYIESL